MRVCVCVWVCACWCVGVGVGLYVSTVHFGLNSILGLAFLLHPQVTADAVPFLAEFTNLYNYSNVHGDIVVPYGTTSMAGIGVLPPPQSPAQVLHPLSGPPVMQYARAAPTPVFLRPEGQVEGVSSVKAAVLSSGGSAVVHYLLRPWRQVGFPTVARVPRSPPPPPRCPTIDTIERYAPNSVRKGDKAQNPVEAAQLLPHSGRRGGTRTATHCPSDTHNQGTEMAMKVVRQGRLELSGGSTPDLLRPVSNGRRSASLRARTCRSR